MPHARSFCPVLVLLTAFSGPLATAPAHADPADMPVPADSAATAADGGAAFAVEQWGDSLSVDARVIEEIRRFEKELGEEYAKDLASRLRRTLFEKAVARIRAIESGERGSFIEAEFPDAGFLDGQKPEDEAEREFQEGFLFTEFLAFIESGGTPVDEAMRIYTAPEFRQTVSSRIERIFEEDGLSCVETSGVKALLSPTLACNKIEELHAASVSSQHSQVVANPSDDHQTVYFKESLKTFVEIPEGICVHYVHYTRAKKLGRLKKLVGRGKVESSQERALEELQSRLVPPTE